MRWFRRHKKKPSEVVVQVGRNGSVSVVGQHVKGDLSITTIDGKTTVLVDGKQVHPVEET